VIEAGGADEKGERPDQRDLPDRLVAGFNGPSDERE
jgi:hypothetical protein